eukprot:TRINITY_DN65922_c5_g7_i1.p1 TRINITY_DN65922_c5_g7~~TRINITY_DN65922_c5_g7_i1.p1  ORF type:complete len:257 (-),score=23.40 TRINITY_DN65922_c5_g7_i1:136-906(-)
MSETCSSAFTDLPLDTIEVLCQYISDLNMLLCVSNKLYYFLSAPEQAHLWKAMLLARCKGGLRLLVSNRLISMDELTTFTVRWAGQLDQHIQDYYVSGRLLEGNPVPGRYWHSDADRHSLEEYTLAVCPEGVWQSTWNFNFQWIDDQQSVLGLWLPTSRTTCLLLPVTATREGGHTGWETAPILKCDSTWCTVAKINAKQNSLCTPHNFFDPEDEPGPARKCPENVTLKKKRATASNSMVPNAQRMLKSTLSRPKR